MTLRVTRRLLSRLAIPTSRATTASLNRAVPASRAAATSLNRVENRLVVTGGAASLEAFKTDALVSPASLSFLPRGLAWFGEPTTLTFERLLPIARPTLEAPEELAMARWGCATDAIDASVHEGAPRAKGRASVVLEFETGQQPPLAWLAAAAESQPTLRFGLKWAHPSSKAAYEAVYQEARLIHKTQVSYHGWVWEHKVAKAALFDELKALLRFPDGRVPRKRKLKAADVEARLRAAGAYTQAVMLLAYHANDWGGAREVRAEGVAVPVRQERVFHSLVLPEFVAWLRSAEGLRLGGA